MYTLSDFDYHLPAERIAQTPATPRDSSKLLIVDRKTQSLTDERFYNLADLLTPNDVLVLNNTKVFPARLFVEKIPSRKPIEILLEKEVSLTPTSITWDALTKPGLKVGDHIVIPNTTIEGECVAVQDYTRTLTFSVSREAFLTTLDQWAHTPVPPYINWERHDERKLRQLYQTVYAKTQGAVAAPTAGLHFTAELLEKIQESKVAIEYVTLHVGLGTFLPVKTEAIQDHLMHSEWFELKGEIANRLNQAKSQGKRIIAVGTTTVRVLESCANTHHRLSPTIGETDIFIYPPYTFKFVDSMITNFHTPKSTLLMLICAFVTHPNTHEHFTNFSSSVMGEAYNYALENNYRFYSFGDAMWIE